MTAAPLAQVEFDDLLAAIGGFETRPLLAVAVSGGPDSLALMLLADRWARRRGGEAWGLHVDHRLRSESADEAGTLAGWLAGRAIPHALLGWDGVKPGSGIQEAARTARYELLGDWCRRRGCLHLLTAHHREDQIETHLIRRRAGSGIDGLAGISAVRSLPGCRLVRPLLSVPKARLAALLAAEQQPFLRDPSNLNPAFARARLRLAGEPADNDALAAEVRDYGGRRIAREKALDALLARTVALHPAGFATLDAAALATADSDSAERLLGRLAACIGAAQYPARRERLARLRAALTARPVRARTLGGCRFVPWRGRILVLRELAAASPPARIDPAMHFIWDRRFAVELADTATTSLTLDYLGTTTIADRTHDASALPRLLNPVLPALWDAQGLVAVPHRGYRRCDAPTLPRLSFRPATPLAQAGFTVV